MIDYCRKRSHIWMATLSACSDHLSQVRGPAPRQRRRGHRGRGWYQQSAPSGHLRRYSASGCQPRYSRKLRRPQMEQYLELAAFAADICSLCRTMQSPVGEELRIMHDPGAADGPVGSVRVLPRLAGKRGVADGAGRAGSPRSADGRFF